MQLKKCSKCFVKQSLNYFTKDKQKIDWLRSSCKLCNKKWLTKKELWDIELNNINIYQKKHCSKCKLNLELNNFRKDWSKKNWYYSSCNDCLRIKTWAKKHIPIEWWRSYYSWYRKYILERDWNACVISWDKTDLHIHHIKTRWAWWSNEYNNLITLSWKIHREKAHWMELEKYRKIFEKYTSQFERPNFWDKIMEESKKNNDNTKKRINERNNKYMKNRYKIKKEEYKKNNNWLTYSQVLYRRKKEYLKNKIHSLNL